MNQGCSTHAICNVKQPCDCCDGPRVLTPLPAYNRPGLSALRYRVGTHGTFFETMQARLSSVDYPRARGPPDAREERPLDRAAGRLVRRRRCAELLSGAHRQRRLSAHRHRAAFGAGAGAAHRLCPASRGVGQRLSRLFARQERGAGDHPPGRARQQHSRTGRADAGLRNLGAAGSTGGVERHQAPSHATADRGLHRPEWFVPEWAPRPGSRPTIPF